MGPFLPRSIKRKKPATVGGNTRGRVNNPSKTHANLPFVFITLCAAYVPIKKVITVAYIAVSLK